MKWFWLAMTFINFVCALVRHQVFKDTLGAIYDMTHVSFCAVMMTSCKTPVVVVKNDTDGNLFI